MSQIKVDIYNIQQYTGRLVDNVILTVDGVEYELTQEYIEIETNSDEARLQIIYQEGEPDIMEQYGISFKSKQTIRLSVDGFINKAYNLLGKREEVLINLSLFCLEICMLSVCGLICDQNFNTTSSGYEERSKTNVYKKYGIEGLIFDVETSKEQWAGFLINALIVIGIVIVILTLLYGDF